ncbi:MAG TPA: energy transducer TonB [Gemmatimonadaceae bacterium]|nr:energy transducer TonB [Gemmatimonadaceae bacterium]
MFAAAGPVFRDCAVDSRASLLVANPRIDFQPPRAVTNCYSAEVEFVVDTNGTPEMQTAGIVRATDQSFGQAVLTAVAGWRYKPAERDGHRVRQIVEDRRMAQTVLVAVPAGSPPPSGPPPRTAVPRC